jgi:short-subunit dehydrogenase
MARRDLRHKVAIVTGASSGLGWASAVKLGEEGMRLCVTARRADALEALRAQLASREVDAIAVPADVTREDEVERVVAACVERFGRLDLLVNNAAVQVYAHFEDYEWREIERVFDVVVYGYMRFTRAALPHFRRQNRGHILNVLSMLAVGAAPLLSTYTAAKHALLGWAESLRLELWKSGIDVSNVLAPSMSTPMFDHAQMKLGRAPKPIPPTYPTELIARAVARTAARPARRVVPVVLQGKLILWLQRLAPFAGDLILAAFGERMQMRHEAVDPAHGNLFVPVPEGIGPRGSVPPTPRWLRVSAGTALAAGLAALGWGAARAARRLARAS